MYTDRLFIFLILLAYLFSPILLRWWTQGDLGWYQPFVFWGILIGLSYFATRKSLSEKDW